MKSGFRKLSTNLLGLPGFLFLFALPAFANDTATLKPACRVFDRYVARVVGSNVVAGENIEILKRDSAPDPCAGKVDVIFKITDQMGIWLWDIYKDLLILDVGTGTERGVRVIDLRTSRQVYEGSAQGLKFSSPGILSFAEQMGGMFVYPRASCLARFPMAWKQYKQDHSPLFDNAQMPDCARCTDWEKHLGTGFSVHVEFDLNTLKKRYIGKVYCDARE